MFKMFKWKLLVSAAILSVVLAAVAGCTQADLQNLQGTLKNVDSVSGNVTVTLNDGTTRTFNFTDVEVDTIRQAMGNATLEVGDQVKIKVRVNGDVEEVEVDNAEVHGIIKSLGADALTITTRKQGDITLKLTAETKIRIEDSGTAAFSDLKVGQEVEIKYDVTTKNALRINVDEDEAEDEGEIEGIIKAIGTDNKTITITKENNADVTLNVISGTVIEIEEDRTGAFSDLKVGQKIEADYDVSTMNAQKLEIQDND